MIKILDQDNIIDVVNKINNCQDKEIVLDFPYGHNILHNYMSLKILKNKVGTKRITIVTTDLISKKIGEPLGINYSIIKDNEFIDINQKGYIMKHNFSFFEYFLFEMKKYYHRFLRFLGKKTNFEEIISKNPFNKIKSGSVFFLMLGVFLSIFMLFFIFYFAVNKTYIEITPDISIKTKAINMSFIENIGNEKILGNNLQTEIKKISTKISLNYNYKTTAIDYEKTKRAFGEVIFINELREEQVFKPKTRVLASDGKIVFETTDWIKIPPSKYMSGELVYGKQKANIVAKIQDSEGKFIGSRGNIEPQILTIPGLKFNGNKIYAQLEKPTIGGEDDLVYMVGEDDEENSKKVFLEILKKEALNSLKKKIEEENQKTGIKYEILGIKDILKYKNEKINLINSIKLNQKISSFDLVGNITLETYVFNKDQALTQLKNVIQESLISGTDKLMSIDENSLKTTVVLSQSENPLKIKATVEINSGLSYDFDNNMNFYNKRLKTLISGLSNDEAKNILLNEDRISNVNIKNTPFFIKKVSSNIDNIILKIKDENINNHF